MFAPLEVFCCYAREDQAMLEQLKRHLTPLQRHGQIVIWSDTNLNAGDEWEKVLQQHLGSADIILLLISADFMSSEYCYSNEMKRAIERHEEGSARVIPVLLRRVFWDNAPFAKLQMLPAQARSVTSWPDRDEAFHDITLQVSLVVRELQLGKGLMEAREAANAGHHQEALALYEQVLRLEPQNGSALFGRAAALYQTGQLDASIDAFALAVQTAPTLETAPLAILQADALTREGRYTEGLAVYERALRFGILRKVVSAEIYAKQGGIFVQLKDYEKALDALGKATRLDPKNVWYLALGGDLLFRLRRYDKALAVYESLCNMRPQNVEYHVQRGRILLKLQRTEDALVVYRQVLTLAPEETYYNQVGKLLLQLKRPQEALDVYSMAIRTKNAETSTFLTGKGRAFVQLERYEEALPCYQRAIELSGSEVDPRLYHELGELLERWAKKVYALERQRRVEWQPRPEDEDLLPAQTLDPARMQVLHTLNGHTGYVYSIAINPDGSLLASGSYDQTIKLWELPSGRELRTLSGHTSYVYSLAISPDGSLLASGSADHTINLWKLPSGQRIPTLPGHTDLVYSLAISPDGSLLASGSQDTTINLWDLPFGRLLHTLPGHAGPVYGLAISPDGSLLASCSGDHTLKLWDLPSGRELHTLSSHTGIVYGLAISPDGSLLASCSDDHTIKLWDLPSKRELHTLPGHTDLVYSLAISPDGSLLASGSQDTTIKLWELPSGRELHTLSGHTALVRSLAFSPDNSMLISCSDDGTIKFWGNA